MKNKVNREIPDEFLVDGVEAFQGSFYRDDYEYTKAAPTIKGQVKPRDSKVMDSIREAIEKVGLKDGMAVSFHHHFRNGDYTASMVFEVIKEMGIKDISLIASSLGKAQASLVPMIEDGTITNISSSGVRAEIGDAISNGKLKNPAMIRSHGGRVRAVETGQVKIDVAFIGAPTSDEYGNASGKGGKSDCGVLSYSDVDARYADKVVVMTDTLVPFPNHPYSVKGINVDCVVKVDQVGDASKIAANSVRVTDDPRELKIAEYAAECVVNTEWFKDGFSYQTGAGGPSLAVTSFLKKHMIKEDIKMDFALGGIVKPMVDMLKEGYIRKIADTQDFDIAGVESVNTTPNHFEITTSEYANPLNKGAYVNKLDYVILGALEVDTDFNVNVVVGSDGKIQGAPGGHVDTSAGSKVSIIVAPLIRGRLATVRDKVTSVTTPGETIDIVVTDYGVAINPLRKDLIEQLEKTNLPLMTIEELKDIAYGIVGEPEDIEYTDEVVALVEYRDGTIIDAIRKVKES